MKDISHERASELLACDFNTGELTWKVSRKKASKGSVAGCPNKAGYLKTFIDGKSYYNHRLVYLLYHGYFPENFVDHINRNKSDNRVSNLREVSRSCNLRNTGNPKNNTSGVKGVYFLKKENKWAAKIPLNKKMRSLGIYKSKEEAICARLAGEQCLGISSCGISPAYRYVKKYIQNKQHHAFSSVDYTGLS